MKIRSEKNIKRNIGFQLFFWMALFLFNTARNYSESGQPEFKEFFIYDICHWIFHIIGANFIYYGLIRKFFDTKKYFLFTISLIISLYLISVINRLFIVYMAEPLFVNYPKDSFTNILTDINYLLFHYTFPLVTASFIFTAMIFMLRYKNEKENSTRLLKEKAELELKALQSQLNPHFLFNTLNNIYALSITGSPKTSESISRLSDIFDFLLYKGQNQTILISDEAAVIDNYIELEKLRYDESLKINKFKELKSPNTIPPLLYLSLVENAFKHGAGKVTGTKEINIKIETDDQNSVFTVENTYPENENSQKTGIGLFNIKEQLRHHYHNKFEFYVTQEHNWFTVKVITPAKND